jgi:hypothetical protein
MAKTASLVLACSLMLTGCAAEVRGPSVRVKAPYPVSVDHDHGYKGRFCPPGQAKKGRC